jgi:hypothetical protein
VQVQGERRGGVPGRVVDKVARHPLEGVDVTGDPYRLNGPGHGQAGVFDADPVAFGVGEIVEVDHRRCTSVPARRRPVSGPRRTDRLTHLGAGAAAFP